jgi:Zn-dependent M16 (insulinase) family peptidase
MAPESKLDRVASFRDIESLRELLEQHFELHDREHSLLEKANVIAREAMNRSLDEMNNLRRQIEQVEAKFITRDEWSKGHEAVINSHESCARAVDNRFRVVERLIWMASGAVMLIALLMHWLKP